jgi:ActR/RegA family two-component response regulator
MTVAWPEPAQEVRTLLVVHLENDSSYETRLRRRFEVSGFRYEFTGVLSDISNFRHQDVAIYIFDWKLPGAQNATRFVMDVIRQVQETHPRSVIAVLTNFAEDPDIAALVDEGVLRAESIFVKRNLDDDEFVARLMQQTKNAAPNMSTLVSEIRCGTFIYRLRQPSSRSDIVAKLADLTVGLVQSADFDRVFHELFQSLLHIPVHEMLDGELTLWRSVLEFVDMDAYAKDQPIADTKVGRVVERTRDTIVLEWFGGDIVRYDLFDVPGVLVRAKAGDTVSWTTLTLRSGKVLNCDCVLSPELSNDNVDLDQVHGIDELPEADWPLRRDES